MQQLDAIANRAWTWAQRRFPEHHLLLRSGDAVRHITIGTRTQIMAAGTAALVAGWMGVATFGMLTGPGSDEMAAKEAELTRMEQNVAALRADMTDLRGDVATAAQRLEQRQKFLAQLLSGKGDVRQLAELMPRDEPDVAELAEAAPQPALLAPFAKLEREQLAFVDKATVAAEARYRDNKALLRRLGLDSDRFLRQSSIAMGGPLDEKGGPLADAEPEFKDLFVSWKKVDQLEQAMTAIPSYTPVKSFSYSSGFGVRYDPFTGRAAMHAGVDMAGSHGEPIYAAADGVVTSAGRNGAYGNAIDIGHGKGLSTRYGHLARVLVRAGERVEKGQVIGRMGSTGRSTGTHLHYEVRIDGRAVNPMPFLRAANYVLAVQTRAERGQGGPEIAAD